MSTASILLASALLMIFVTINQTYGAIIVTEGWTVVGLEKNQNEISICMWCNDCEWSL